MRKSANKKQFTSSDGSASSQWRTHKIFTVCVCSFSGVRWSFVFSVRCLWRQNMTSYHVSKPPFWRSLFI